MFLPWALALWQSDWKAPYLKVADSVRIESYVQKLGRKKFGFYIDGDLLTMVAKGETNPLQIPDWFQSPLVQDAKAGAWILQLRMSDWSESFFNYRIKDEKGNLTSATFRGPKAPKALSLASKLKGTVTDYTLDSKELGMERKVTVYIPASPTPNMPVVLMADGQSCNEFARTLEPLILAKKVRPTAIVGIHHGPYLGSSEKFEFEKDYRMREYLKVFDPERFAAHLSFACDQVLPWARDKFGLSKRKEDTAVFGYSNGGAFALTAAIDRPDVFGYSMPHSVAAISREDLQKADLSKLTTRFYFTAGTLEVFISNTDFAFQTLMKKGVPCEMSPYVSGHDLGMWQLGFAEAIQRIFPPSQTSSKNLAWKRWMEGRKLNSEKKWSEALAALEDSYKSWPFTEPHFYQPAVLASGNLGDMEKAFAYLEKMTKLGWINAESLEADESYRPVTSDSRWKLLKENARTQTLAMLENQDPANLRLGESRLEDRARKLIDNAYIRDSELPQKLKKLGGFIQPKQTGLWVKYTNHYKHFDGSEWDQPYFVHIPKDYKASQRTPLLIFSNGGWFGAKQFRNILDKEFQFDNPPFEWLEKQGFIQVYPYGNQATATYQLNGLDNYQQILRAIKNEFNIDDNRISLMGYSDGGTGAYRAASLQPSPYASFAPLNGYVYTTNAVSNYINRPIFSLSADQDAVFSVSNMKRYHRFAESSGTKWEQTIVHGNGHSYWPFVKEFMPQITRQIVGAKRNPFFRYLRWEAGDSAVGEVDWLKLETFDVNLARQVWQTEFKFTEKDDDGKDEEISMNARTGMVEAIYRENTFFLKTSRVKEVTLKIDPDMVDLAKPVKVIVNGKLRFQDDVKIDRKKTETSFLKDLDRSRVWVNDLKVLVN